MIVFVNKDDEGLTMRGDGFAGDWNTYLFESDCERMLAAPDVCVVVPLFPCTEFLKPMVIEAEGLDAF